MFRSTKPFNFVILCVLAMAAHAEDSVVWSGKSSVDMRTGKTMWTYPALNDDSSMESVVVGQDVIVQDTDGKIERLSLKDGHTIWRAMEPDKSGKHDSARICVTSKLLFCVSRESIHAFDLDSGKEVWTVNLELENYKGAPRVIASEDGILLFSGKKCNYYEIAEGKKRWAFDGGAYQASFISGGDIVILYKEKIARVSSADGHQLWDAPISDRSRHRSLRIAGQYVVTGGCDPDEQKSQIEIFDQNTGQKTFERQGCLISATIGAKNRLFLAKGNGFFHEGELIALNPDGWKEEWTFSLGKGGGVDLLADGNRLFLCEYDTRSCGTALKCLDAYGLIRWTGKVTGVLVSHFYYEQTTHLIRRNDDVMLISNQLAGEFVEAFDADSGEAGPKWLRLFGHW